MREDTFGKLRVRLTGGTDREGGGDGPVVVLLHGFGAPGDDLVPLWRVLDVPHEVRFVFPEAPLSLAEAGFPGGRAWWMLDLEALQRRGQGEAQDRSAETPEGLDDAKAQLLEMLEVLQARMSVTPAQVVLGGFSQGSMLACACALDGFSPAGLVLLSSTLIDSGRWLPAMPKLAHVPVLQTHGRSDQVLPIEGARALHAALVDHGVGVRWVEFGGGHELPPTALEATAAFIQKQLA